MTDTRILSASESCEIMVLGALINSVKPSSSVGLKPKHFHNYRNQQICKAVNEAVIDRPSSAADCAVKVSLLLEKVGVFDAIGGMQGLIDLISSCESIDIAKSYAEPVLQQYHRRVIKEELDALNRLTKDGRFDLGEVGEMIRETGERCKGENALKVLSVTELVENYPTLREPVIEGLLRRGETMNLVSATKVGKSWLAINLALCVSTGRPFLHKFRTTPARVLHIDTELHEETLSNRISAVADAMGLSLSHCPNYDTLAVRGKGWSVDNLRDVIVEKQPDVVLLDALYRAVPKDKDENSNREMALVYNAIDRSADVYNASVIMIHHSTKGVQSGKAITDIGSGAGAMSRAVDTHAVMVQHEDRENVFVFKSKVRSFEEPAEVALIRKHPLWVHADPAVHDERDVDAAVNLMMHNQGIQVDKVLPITKVSSISAEVQVCRNIVKVKGGKAKRKEFLENWIECSGGIPLPSKAQIGRILSRAVSQNALHIKGKPPGSWYELPPQKPKDDEPPKTQVTFL